MPPTLFQHISRSFPLHNLPLPLLLSHTCKSSLYSSLIFHLHSRFCCHYKFLAITLRQTFHLVYSTICLVCASLICGKMARSMAIVSALPPSANWCIMEISSGVNITRLLPSSERLTASTSLISAFWVE